MSLEDIKDPALREAMREIMDKLDQVQHSQVKVIEALLIQMLGNDPAKIDTSWIEEYLKNR